MTADRVTRVEILGQRYPIRSDLDEPYLNALASYVEQKLRAAADATPAGDTVRLAVIAALNIADEFFRCRDGEDWQIANRCLAERTAALEQLMTKVLDEGA
ncbi:MAG: cell division protein ZapA [Acidobacteria bacterium]|nr:cell division protein ZapA [Acidobacteriota bacterium]